MLETARAWLDSNSTILWALGGLSVVTFVGSLIALPWLVAALPRDYFARDEGWVPAWGRHHPLVRWSLRIIKSGLGLALIAAGFAMLALPGQGVLTIVVGLMLLEFPGKRRFIRWLGRRERVRQGLNWLRVKMHKPHFTPAHEQREPARR